jgi:hypothetical protein
MAVIIEEIDAPNRVAHARDKFGGKLQISYDSSTGGMTFVPEVNEVWVVVRDELQWAFIYRVEDGTGTDRVPVGDLAAGDTKIRAANAIQFDAASIMVNGFPIGLTIWERFELSADTDEVVLIKQPVDIRSVQVHNNRSLVDPFGIAVSDEERTLTFSPALSAGVAIVYYQYIPTAIKVDDLLS